MPADTVSVIRPRTYEEAAVAVRACGARGAVARGGPGRTHGDAACNAGGAVLDMTGLDRVHVVDAAEGIVLCDAGVPLLRLAEVLLPLGWSVPLLPAARHVTVGGAIGADLHGAEHRVAGSFGRQVLALELLTADGQVRAVTPGTELFEATAGGLGLTGVILTATVRLLPAETAYLTVDTERAGSLDEVLARLTVTAGHDDRRYAAARIDLTARGAATGRGILTRARHTPPGALRATGTRAWRGPLFPRPRRLPPLGSLLPSLLPSGLHYRATPRARTRELRPSAAYVTPQDVFPYGRGGRVRYQFAVGHGQEEALHRIVRRLAGRRPPSCHAVLHPLGEAGPGWLSLTAPGWSLSLDLPLALPGLPGFLDGLDEEVAAAGGRVGLARDARLRPDLLTAMYPRAADFRALRARFDPRGVFTSDLARRLAL
ncbi:FAD-binding oxidoreductase [Streptomyces sp. CoH27]|uniref:FAD-binding oxidoreductase n=1 Tax=Streptomyces sp. CoH27 TaxID=2875763 RepID=UPI001CD2D6C9|nr:FAD-binding oxidoreductase [Streptomyces sp. CoH27]